MRDPKQHLSFDQKIGANLRRLRLSAGLTQTDLAMVLDVTFQQIQKYEKGANRLPLEGLHRLAALFAVEPGIFFEGISTPGITARPAAPPDDRALRLCRKIMAVRDNALREKIIQVISVLAA